jgi:adenine phosphoribosyltransferase
MILVWALVETVLFCDKKVQKVSHSDRYENTILTNLPSVASFFYSHRTALSVNSRVGDISLREIISDYADFPQQGILFRDVNPVFRRYDALNFISDEFHRRFSKVKVDVVAGIESRGFVVATALALSFHVGVIMIRKAGKLPGITVRRSYEIEYGRAVMEVQRDAIKKGQNVLVADDLIATGGTSVAASQLIEELGGKVAGFAFVIELSNLEGSQRLRKMGYDVQSLVTYP